jgi:lipopolysaccharide export system permease protein
MGFKEYKRQFDLSSFGLKQRTADSVNKDNARMLSMRQLNVAIDSIRRLDNRIAQRAARDIFGLLSFSSYMDSTWKQQPVKVNVKTFEQLIPDSIKAVVHQRVNNKLNSLKLNTEVLVAQYQDQQRSLRLHKIEWHRKITLSVACLVLFMIGAPLGSIIRKGGLGSPLVFAIIFFMLFYFSSTTGEKFAKEGSTSPEIVMWLSTFVLIPVGIFLTYKAMKDSQVFNKEAYGAFFRKIKGFVSRKSNK